MMFSKRTSIFNLKINTMTIKIVTSEKQAEFLKDLLQVGIESITYKPSPEGGFYDTTIVFEDYCDVDLIAQIIFGAGVSYGLDLKYSSYDNNLPR
jgi:hypothetical protein